MPQGMRCINSLAPGGFDYSLKLGNFKLLISTIVIWSIFCEIAIMWMPQYLTDHQSTLVQVMAWCRQATSHYLSQCWPGSLSPYDVTRPQWVNAAVKTWWPWDAIRGHRTESTLASGTKPLPDPMLNSHQQSGTKLNLVAKSLATKFGFVSDWSVVSSDNQLRAISPEILKVLYVSWCASLV